MSLVSSFVRQREGLEKAVHAGEVLAEDVELDVDYGADRNILEVGVLVGIGDDAHGYIALAVLDIGFAHSETDTVDADRTLVHTEVAALYHLPVGVVLKTIVPTAVRLTHLYATCGLVHVPLHDMPVEALVEEHGTFDIDPVALFERTEVGTVEGLLHSRDGIEVALRPDHREAHSVVRNRLVDTQRLRIGITEREMLVGLLGLNPDDLRHGFYNT